MYELGDILTCWRIKNDPSDFISIDKIISIVDGIIYSRYFAIVLIFNDDLSWEENYLDINHYNYCKLEEYKKYQELNKYDNIINILKKEFFKEYEVDSRKIKLNKLNHGSNNF